MKGVKKCYGLLLVLFTIFTALFVVSSDASASPLSTDGVKFEYSTNNGSSYQWSSPITFPVNGVVGDYLSNATNVRKYSFVANNVQSTGNYASIHFETNLIYIINSPAVNSGDVRWINIDQIEVLACSFGGNPLSIQSQSTSGVQTLWDWDNTAGRNRRNTLTIYGDVIFGDLQSGTTGNLVCDVGVASNSGSFIYVSRYASLVDIYPEQNPANIVFSNQIDNSLLQTQINQNQTIINQNDIMINQQQQTYDWLTDNSAPSADTSALGQSAGWLPAGPVDSILTLPVTLAQGIVGVFTGTHTCTPIVLPFSLGPYNESLTIPCMDEYFRIAQISILWNAVGSIIAAFIVYDTLKWLYKFVDDTLTLRENNSGLWGGL